MGFFFSAILLQSGLPPVSRMLNSEAMLVTTVTVACLGLAVMMLTRSRTERQAPEIAPECVNPAPAPALAHEVQSPVTANGQYPEVPAMVVDSLAAALAETPMNAVSVVTAHEPVEAELAATPVTAVAPRAASHGASALIAKASSLLPAGPADQRSMTAKPTRGPGFQPAARFSRSQQAFLRIPVVLSGLDEFGCEFREETTTVILLPQGAVIHLPQKLRAGGQVTLLIPDRQKEVACEVFGVLRGPDGRTLVEVEFAEFQKSIWPVSFPAWAGRSGARAKALQSPGAVAPVRAAALDSSDS